MFVLARRNFQKTGKENRHAPYDAGAAWMALALQARKLGLYAHAMAGFNQEKAYEVLGASREEYLVMAAIAVGRKTEDSGLPDDLRAMESPNSRKPHAEVATSVFPLSHPAWRHRRPRRKSRHKPKSIVLSDGFQPRPDAVDRITFSIAAGCRSHKTEIHFLSQMNSPLLSLVDTHAHLCSPEFAHDLDDVLCGRARRESGPSSRSAKPSRMPSETSSLQKFPIR